MKIKEARFLSCLFARRTRQNTSFCVIFRYFIVLYPVYIAKHNRIHHNRVKRYGFVMYYRIFVYKHRISTEYI